MCLHVTVSHPRIINLLHALTTALLESGTFYVAMRREFFEVCVPKVLIGVFQEGENLFILTRCSQYRSISFSTIFVLNAPNKFLFGCCYRCLIFREAAVHKGITLFSLHLNSKQWRWIEGHFTAPNLVETAVSGSGIHLSFSKA